MVMKPLGSFRRIWQLAIGHADVKTDYLAFQIK